MNTRLLLGVVIVSVLFALFLMCGSHPNENEANTDAPAPLDRNATSPDEQGESGSLIEPPSD